MRDGDIDSLSADGAQEPEPQPFRLAETEAHFQARVEGLASFLGWEWIHIQRALNDRGHWRTPVRGHLGPGWPDLVMIKGQRIVACELKSERGRLSPAQERVLRLLALAGIECHVWHPADWDHITEVLGAHPNPAHSPL